LCNYRRRLGLPALSINWGPWAGGGMATPEAQRWLSLTGVQTLQPEEALVALGLLLHDNPPQCAVARVDWSRLGELFEIKGPRQLFDHLQGVAEKESGRQPAKPARSAAILQQLQQAPQNERSRLLSTYLQGQVATILGLADPNAVLPQSGFFELGMDSLMAVELKNRLAADLSLSLRPTVAFDFPNVEKLSELLNEMTLTRRAPSPTLWSASYGVPGIRADPPAEQVEAMIAEKMARLEELAKG
jgi:acyl carrier protein